MAKRHCIYITDTNGKEGFLTTGKNEKMYFCKRTAIKYRDMAIAQGYDSSISRSLTCKSTK